MHSAPSSRGAAGRRPSLTNTLWSPAVPDRAIDGLHQLDVAPEHTNTAPSIHIESALDEDVQISLGIGSAWSLGLKWVGSLSLAWQHEHADVLDDVPDTASVFGTSVERAKEEPPVDARRVRSDRADSARRSRSTAVRSDNSSSHTVRSFNEHAHVRQLTRQLSKVLEVDVRTRGAVSDDSTAGVHGRMRRKREPHKKKRRDRRAAEAVDGAAEPSKREKRGRSRKHRSSARPSKLVLPTADPRIAGGSTDVPPQLTRQQRIDGVHQSLSGSTIVPAAARQIYEPAARPAHRRTKSLPLPDTAHGIQVPGALQPPLFRQAASTTMAAAKLLTEEQYMLMLEDRVSGMFVELGLRAPYMDSARSLPEEDEVPVSCACETPLWFLSSEYATGSAQTCQHGRYIVLMDDDSSYSE
ncbi:hypothetical protein GGF43_001354 [Coemansia sp. RSA 2618]|nr:hypothetical protein GGF43_001354 [Coemansia sp. RSA 2618]